MFHDKFPYFLILQKILGIKTVFGKPSGAPGINVS